MPEVTGRVVRRDISVVRGENVSLNTQEVFYVFAQVLDTCSVKRSAGEAWMVKSLKSIRLQRLGKAWSFS